MKAFVPLIVFLLAAALAAGCTGSQPAATPAPTAAGSGVTSTPTSTPTVSFALGESYLSRPTPYSFSTNAKPYTEGPFRITNEPWGIEFTINPLTDDVQSTWFTITATNIDSGQSETYGYGRTFSSDKHQLIPMYGSGPYKFEMNGNLVSVKVDIAKRKP